MKPIAKCGTRSGYNRHLRLIEPVCDMCRDAQNSYDRKRFENNPDYFRIKNKKNENKEKKKARWRKREAIRKNSFSIPYLESEVLEKYGTLCYICSEEINLSVSRRAGIGKGWRNGLHIDHVIPLSQGGPDSLENVRPSHAICNLKKGKQLISKEM